MAELGEQTKAILRYMFNRTYAELIAAQRYATLYPLEVARARMHWVAQRMQEEKADG